MDDAKSDRSRREFALVWVWLALVLSVAAGVVVAVLLWGGTRAEHRDAFDTGWKSAAAILAVLAAFVTVERLRLGQREHHRQLAADQAAHITDLSSKVSEQLGSEKAAVRIGGLTDLERLAQSYPTLRQTVVDRICAYLRAPYQPPADFARPTNKPLATGPDMDTDRADESDPDLSDEVIAARRLELDVRRTAQRILHRHLQWPTDAAEPTDSFWDMISLDLRDAVLVEAELTDCRIASVDFRNATFHGYTRFKSTTFTGGVEFENATFMGDAGFDETIFSGDAGFDEATFTGDAWFTGATFTENAGFDEATFTGDAWFDGATFTGGAWFSGATFSENAWFSGTTFSENAWFDGATFTGDAWFTGATFSENASFDGATFSGNVQFDAATLKSGISLGNARIVNPSAGYVWPDLGT